MTKARNTQTQTPAPSSDETTAMAEEMLLGPAMLDTDEDDDEDMVDNRQPLHASMHKTHEADTHYEGDTHLEDELGEFVPPGQLDTPAARDGMVQRWVRFDVHGNPDANNRAKSARRGWQPRRLDTVPAGMQKHYPALQHKQFGDIIMQGDLVLCERPAAYAAREQKFFRNRAERQQALHDVMATGPQKAQGGFEPIHIAERKSRVVTRKPIQVADGG